MPTDRESARLKKVTVTIKKEWEPVNPDNAEDVALAAKLSEVPVVWNMNPKKTSMSQKREVSHFIDAGSKENVEMGVGPTMATVSGDLLDE